MIRIVNCSRVSNIVVCKLEKELNSIKGLDQYLSCALLVLVRDKPQQITSWWDVCWRRVFLYLSGSHYDPELCMGEVYGFFGQQVVLYSRAFTEPGHDAVYTVLHEIGHYVDRNWFRRTFCYARAEKFADEFANKFEY
jgi:hypothetical protein